MKLLQNFINKVKDVLFEKGRIFLRDIKTMFINAAVDLVQIYRKDVYFAIVNFYRHNANFYG